MKFESIPRFTKKLVLVWIPTWIGVFTGLFFLTSALPEWIRPFKKTEMPAIEGDQKAKFFAVQEHLERLHQQQKWRGHISYILNGELYHHAFDERSQKKWSPQTRSLTASVSKALVGYMAYKLDQSGELKLDEKLCHYIDECEGEASVADMLGHRAGLAEYPSPRKSIFLDLWAIFFGADLDWIVKSRLPLVTAQSDFKYANFNFDLASYLIEKNTDKTFGENVSQHLAAPLGLENTFLLHDSGKEIVRPGCPFGLHLYFQDCPPFLSYQSFWGSGGIVSSTEDLIKISQHLIDDGFFEFLENYHKKTGHQYVLGWVRLNSELYWHNGRTLGYHAEFFVNPKTKAALALLSNFNAGESVSAYMHEIPKILVRKKYQSLSVD